MNEKQIENINNDLNNFLNFIKENYYIDLDFNIDDIIKKDFDNKMKVTLKELHEIIIMTAEKYDPLVLNELFNTRKRPAINYSHCFAYIADKLGYKKIEIGAYTGKHHATIINAINRSKGFIQSRDSEFTITYKSILNTYNYYVGNISNNIQEQINT